MSREDPDVYQVLLAAVECVRGKQVCLVGYPMAERLTTRARSNKAKRLAKPREWSVDVNGRSALSLGRRCEVVVSVQ